MSAYNSTLLSLPATNDHFQSAFMQGYGTHHYDEHRYSSSSQYFSNPPPDTYFNERRLNEQYMRSSAAHIPRLSGTNNAPSGYSAASFDYGNVRNMPEFDPRPPHAGWTPKEEDDEAQQRELLSGGGMSSRTPPAGGDMGLHPGDLSPRSDSLSPGLSSLSALSGGPNGSGASGSGVNSKTYSFVSLPGNAVRKRPRRRYDEIERLYACSWPECTKAYGTLNHLNAHVTMQRHGSKRSPSEFKELRKQWRAQKKHEHPTHSVQRSSSNSSHATLVPSSAPSSGGLTPDFDISLRHRRATEPSLPMHSLHHPGHPHLAPHPSYNMHHHRLSLGDLRYPNAEEDHALATTPSSTTSEVGLPPNGAGTAGGYWHDSPLSSYSLSLQPQQHHNTNTPPLTPLTPPMHHQSMSRLAPGSTLLQPLSAGTLAALEAGLENQSMGTGDNRS
ncbi:hypothetical protein M422DRAFT_240334 [Sphaerobolus stellatus SS14]|nr:hypothetical protein M422DRAFT_240334 [Sphaerobolus stellatus SS14]